MSGIFDSHAHYDDAAFDADREALLAALPAEGVCGVVNCGTDVATSRRAIAFAETYDYFYAACGVHPEQAPDMAEGDLAQIEALLAHPRCVALGEIGLDYYWDIPKPVQLDVFERQLAMAVRLDIPVIVHDREAHGDVMALLREYRPKGVLHCFSGSAETAKEALSLGLYLGFGGSLTFKNAVRPVQAFAVTPADRFLLETDCPYMSPVPLRGKRNDSRNIRFVAQKAAQIKGVEPQEILRAAEENTKRLFDI